MPEKDMRSFFVEADNRDDNPEDVFASALESYQDMQKRIAPFVKPKPLTRRPEPQEWRRTKITEFPNRQSLATRQHKDVSA